MHLLKNPKAYLRAQQEVENIVGTGAIEVKHVKEMVYLNAVLRETLRLTPTVTLLTKMIHPDRKHEAVTICDGRYTLDPNTHIRVLLGKVMRDPTYFGDDANDFNPDRMLETNPSFKHYMKAFKAFGNGSRSCIGQNFAWQEAVLACAMVLQNFDMSFPGAGYKLHFQQNLTVKPRDLYVKVKLRKGITPTSLNERLHSSGAVPGRAEHQAASSTLTDQTKGGLTILYGSNSGTCHSLAQKLGSTAATQLGLKTSILDLDSGIDSLTQGYPVIVITASYEGQPPDNAARFVKWLESPASTNLKGVEYSVFGCGHRDWHETFHRIPKLIDSTLQERGARRIHDLGVTDVSLGHVLDDFDSWQEGLLKVIQRLTGASITERETELADQAEIRTDVRASRLSNGLIVAKVKDVRLLTSPGQPEKHHMEIELPPDAEYDCGDYLAVLPTNPEALVQRIMAHWKLPWDSTITLKSHVFAPLPEHTVLSIYDVLKSYFELSQPASKKVTRDGSDECMFKLTVVGSRVSQEVYS